MALDLRTIYVVASLTLVLLGAIQLAAYATGRFQRWPLWWSASNIVTGLGCLFIAMRDIAPDLLSVDLGNAATLGGYVLMLVAIRVFAGKKADDLRIVMAAIVAGSLVFVLFLGGPDEAMGRIVFGSAIMCLIDIAVIREGWRLAQREKLYSAWLLVAVYVPTAILFALRALLGLAGNLGGALFENTANDLHAWLAISAVMFLLLRSMVMLMMAAERSHCELAALALRDPLTGLLNREGLARSVERLTRPVALLFDVDHFKTLNDRHGHAAGDEALCIFAETAAAQLRADDVLCRLGGDEFVAVLDSTSTDMAVRIADRIQRAFAEAIALRTEFSVHPTISVGIARAPSAGAALHALLQSADAALYRSKNQGRNRVVVSEAPSFAG